MNVHTYANCCHGIDGVIQQYKKLKQPKEASQMVKRYWWTEDGMDDFERGEYVKHDDYAALAERCERLEGALRGMVSIHDSVTMGQEIERREEWLPKARSALAESNGGKA